MRNALKEVVRELQFSLRFLEGPSNLLDQHSKTIDSDSIFPIASLTKLFTSFAILQLAQAHHLELADSIRKYLRSLPAHWDEISLRQLITHTSGIALSGGNAQDRVSYLRSLGSAKFRFRPGEKMEYNNPAYVLLGWAIEEISGSTLNSFFEKNIFQPLQMSHSFIPDERFTDFVEGSKRIEGKVQGKDYQPPFNAMGGTGGLVSSLSDLEKFADALCAEKLLSKASYTEYFRPNNLISGKIAGTAFCWQIGKEYKKLTFEKHGNIEGYSSWIAISPKNKSFLIILSNLTDLKFHDLSSRVFRLS